MSKYLIVRTNNAGRESYKIDEGFSAKGIAEEVDIRSLIKLEIYKLEDPVFAAKFEED